jgi:hypothetical protein
MHSEASQVGRALREHGFSGRHEVEQDRLIEHNVIVRVLVTEVFLTRGTHEH